jgi:hypothetical protein
MNSANGPIDPSVAGRMPESLTPMSIAEAVAQIDLAVDRDQIFGTMCRGARAHIQFAAVFTVHGELAIGKMALGDRWIERDVLANLSVAIERSAPFRAAAQGRAPYLGRIGEDAVAAAALSALGRKKPTPALLLPIVLRERTVALLYGDAGGHGSASRSRRPFLPRLVSSRRRRRVRIRRRGLRSFWSPSRRETIAQPRRSICCSRSARR